MFIAGNGRRVPETPGKVLFLTCGEDRHSYPMPTGAENIMQTPLDPLEFVSRVRVLLGGCAIAPFDGSFFTLIIGLALPEFVLKPDRFFRLYWQTCESAVFAVYVFIHVPKFLKATFSTDSQYFPKPVRNGEGKEPSFPRLPAENNLYLCEQQILFFYYKYVLTSN